MRLAEELLHAKPLIGTAAVEAYEKAKAFAPDDDEAKMIELVSQPRDSRAS